MLIAQMSDSHINGPDQGGLDVVENARESLEACVAHIMALSPRPDVVLATGDLTHNGRPDEYEILRACLAPLDMPLYAIPGNHDDRAAFRRAFADHDYIPQTGPFVQFVVDDHPLRLVALDTIVPGQHGGYIDAERVAWLDARLAEAPDRPTMVIMHHPPFKIGVAAIDGLNCSGGEALGEVFGRHPQIERLVCGHVHRAAHIRWCGVTASTAPSTLVQLGLDLAPETSMGWVSEPAGCLLHVWRPETGLVTHLSVVGDFGPRMPEPAV